MSESIIISTNRLTLKSVTPELIRTLFNTLGKSEIQLFFDTDEAGFQQLKSMYEQGMETHRISLFYFLLMDPSQSRVLGECGFHTWNRTHRRAELFYALRSDSDKRKGYMSEVLPVVLTHGFNELGMHRIAGLAAADNIPSIRLLERNGFVKEGTMREDYVVNGVNENSECYSLLRPEWEQSRGLE